MTAPRADREHGAAGPDLVEKAGWVALVSGVLIGITAMAALWAMSTPAPCRADQVAFHDHLTGGHTLCVDLDTYQTAVIDRHAEAASQENQ